MNKPRLNWRLHPSAILDLNYAELCQNIPNHIGRACRTQLKIRTDQPSQACLASEVQLGEISHSHLGLATFITIALHHY